MTRSAVGFSLDMRVGGLSSTEPNPGPLRGDFRPIVLTVLGVNSESNRDCGDIASSVSIPDELLCVAANWRSNERTAVGAIGGDVGEAFADAALVLMREMEFCRISNALLLVELTVLLLIDAPRTTVVISDLGVGNFSAVSVEECRQHIRDVFLPLAESSFDLRLRKKKGIRILIQLYHFRLKT